MTIAAYVRVSTEEQNLAGQKREIARWMESKGINLNNVQWYIDKSSGSNMDRPELNQLQKDIFSGAVDTVVVYKLDRLSRKMIECMNLLEKWFEFGIRFVCTSHNIDYSDIMGKLFALMMSAFAEIERENILQRQAAGIAVAKEKGVYKGRKPGAIKPGVDLKRVAKLRAKGLTCAEIGKAIGVSERTVLRYTKMPVPE